MFVFVFICAYFRVIFSTLCVLTKFVLLVYFSGSIERSHWDEMDERAI